MFGSRFARVGASVGVLGVIGSLVAAAGSAGAASQAAVTGNGGVRTQVFKSVSQSGTPSGKITSGTMATQIHAVGNGTMNVQVPVGTSSLRNLNGFASAPTQGNNLVLSQQVSGSLEQRYMSSTDLQPIKVNVSATLDGKPIDPENVVGKSGVLEVKYNVKNTTTAKKQVSYTGPDGAPATKEVDVAQPFVGTMTVVLPPEFSEITAPGGSLAGDSENNTSVGYSLVLFPPLGHAEQTLTYQARMNNGSLPSASFDLLPMKPYSNPVLASTKEMLDGADSLGQQIYGIGDGISETASKLAEDAGQLLATMTSAANNAQKLADMLRGNLGAKAQRTANTAAALWAKAKGKGGIVPAAQDVIDDINAINDALQPANIMNTAQEVPEIAGILALIEQLTASANQLGSLSAPAGSLTASASAIQADPNCTGSTTDDTTCQGAAEAIKAGEGGLPYVYKVSVTGMSIFGQEVPSMKYLTTTVDDLLLAYLPMLPVLLKNIPQYQELLDGRATLQDEIVDSFTQTCDACFSHLVSGTQELASKLKENSVTAQENVTTLQSGIAEGPDAMLSGMQELQTEGADELHTEGASTVEQYGVEAATLDALQQMAEEGQNIPYGNAVGANTTTASVFQLTLAGAATPGKGNAINWLLGIILMAIAGAVGTVAWRHRRDRLA